MENIRATIFDRFDRVARTFLDRMFLASDGLGVILFRASMLRSKFAAYLSRVTPERLIENEFVLENLDPKYRRVLDVGTCDSSLSYELIRRGFEVRGIDLNPCIHPKAMIFEQGDIRKTNFPDYFFDYVIAVSTIEHVGLSGRYGVIEEDPSGDNRAIEEMTRILKPNGRLIITMPFGVPRVVRPYHRIYGPDELRKLIGSRLRIERLDFHVPFLRPTKTNESMAMRVDASLHSQYALVLAVLRKS